MAFKYDRGYMFLAFNDCFCGEREGICVDDLLPPAGGSLMLMRLNIIHRTYMTLPFDVVQAITLQWYPNYGEGQRHHHVFRLVVRSIYRPKLYQPKFHIFELTIVTDRDF